MTGSQASSNASKRVDVLICCAHTDATFARALATALEKLSMSVVVWTDSMDPFLVTAETADGKQLAERATATVVLISPNARRAAALGRVVDAVKRDRLAPALIFPRGDFPVSLTPALFEHRKRPAYLAHLNSATVSPVALYDDDAADDASAPGGLLSLLGKILKRPGLAALAQLDPLRDRIAREPAIDISEVDISKLQAWVDQHGGDPAALKLISDIKQLHARRELKPHAIKTSWERLRQGVGVAAALVAAAGLAIAIGALNAIIWPPPDPKLPDPVETVAEVPADEKRLALLIGINGYPQDVGPLNNPISDVKLIDASLRASGFDTRIVENASRQAIVDALGKLSSDIAKSERDGLAVTVLFYFAGHGIQVNNVNYLVPRDASVPGNLAERTLPDAHLSLRSALIELGEIVSMFGERDQGANILIIDACRNSPLLRRVRGLKRAVGDGDGLVMPDVPNGTFIGFSTSSGGFSEDGFDGNSPFASAFAAEMTPPGRSLHEIFLAVKRRVSRDHPGQIPDMDNDLSADFFFRLLPAAEASK